MFSRAARPLLSTRRVAWRPCRDPPSRCAGGAAAVPGPSLSQRAVARVLPSACVLWWQGPLPLLARWHKRRLHWGFLADVAASKFERRLLVLLWSSYGGSYSSLQLDADLISTERRSCSWSFPFFLIRVHGVRLES